MKNLFALLALMVVAGSSLFAQKVTYNYDRQADFSKYRTYQWVMAEQGRVQNQLLEKNILQAVDEQLAAKGLHRVESNPDVLVTYQVATQKEQQLNTIASGGWGYGPGWRYGMGGGMGTATTTVSTYTVGTLVLSVADGSTKSLVWRGQGSGTVNPSSNPEKNYKKLQNAVKKILKDFPPKVKS